MTEPTPQSSTGQAQPRPSQDEDATYRAFDDYPWNKDPTFKSGLLAILGPPSSSPPPASLPSMATHARIFYYAQRIGITIDYALYTAWLARNPSHTPPDVLPEGYPREEPPLASASAATPWQQAAPKAELWIDKSDQRTEDSLAADGEPDYPMGFAEMIRLLQEGKEIPGIKQIPNTVIREPSIKPVGQRAAPRKPWERQAPVEQPQLDFMRSLDADFPPVNGEEPSPGGPASSHETQ